MEASMEVTRETPYHNFHGSSLNFDRSHSACFCGGSKIQPTSWKWCWLPSRRRKMLLLGSYPHLSQWCKRSTRRAVVRRAHAGLRWRFARTQSLPECLSAKIITVYVVRASILVTCYTAFAVTGTRYHLRRCKDKKQVMMIVRCTAHPQCILPVSKSALTCSILRRSR